VSSAAQGGGTSSRNRVVTGQATSGTSQTAKKEVRPSLARVRTVNNSPTSRYRTGRRIPLIELVVRSLSLLWQPLKSPLRGPER
jgi:hypothetical protein